jgi:3-phosphoshikimate 1-carboxyvinyltransferase
MKINFTTLPKQAAVHLPTSKSISNRVMLIRALCHQPFDIMNGSESEDSAAMQQMLDSTTMIVNANEAGTALRFMTAFYCIHQPETIKIITGAPRLRQRPIADLVEALQSIGADISYVDKQGFAPLKIKSVASLNNTILISASISSQFISALCMIAPCMPKGLQIHLLPPITSVPYIKMTLAVMQYFGIDSIFKDNIINILPQQYIPKAYTIEADWSAATFLYCALLLLPKGEIILENLTFSGIQGDAYIEELCRQFGIQTIKEQNGLKISKQENFDVPTQLINLNRYPDLAIPFIVVCAIQYPQIQITGLQTLLVKESNRVEALQIELLKIGLQLLYVNEILSFEGKINTDSAVVFDTHQDHRIAMALALVAIVHPNISINNPEVVSKSFPDYWNQLQRIGFVML